MPELDVDAQLPQARQADLDGRLSVGGTPEVSRRSRRADRLGLVGWPDLQHRSDGGYAPGSGYSTGVGHSTGYSSDVEYRAGAEEGLDAEDQIGARKAVPSWASISLFLLAMVMLLCLVAVLSANRYAV